MGNNDHLLAKVGTTVKQPQLLVKVDMVQLHGKKPVIYW
jgi:hypothetical protein